MPPRSPFTTDPWPDRIDAWGRGWGLPDLGENVRISISTRMRVSLGRCAPGSGTIRIASFLLDGPPALLEEVVCHELAHVAVLRLHGSRCSPHGREWKDLMRATGRDPRARIPRPEFERLLPLQQSRRVMWEHKCPVCRVRRVAGRPVKEWRCARCQRVGRMGKLVVTRLGTT